MELVTLRQTGDLMRKMAWDYRTDVAPFCTMGLIEFYDKVKNIPYRADPPENETVMRPSYTLQGIGTGGDCDDKSVVMGAYFNCNSIPWRILAVGAYPNKPLHHVLTECKIRGQWVHCDPTYAKCTFGYPLRAYCKWEYI